MSVLRVNKLRVGSFAKVVAIAQAVVALLYGAGFTLAVVAGEITKDSQILKDLGVGVGAAGFAVVLLPLIAFVVGWVQGAVAAVILNFVFRESNGLELEVEEVKK